MDGATAHVMERWDRLGSLLVSRCTRRPLAATLMKALSRLGDGHLYPLVGLVLIVADPVLARTAVPAALLAFSVEVSVQVTLKSLTRRPRPFHGPDPPDLRIPPPTDFSFPSGHAAGAFIMAFSITRVIPSLAIPSYLVATLIAISRVANGVHYPSDVVAGVALGLLSAALGLWVL